MEVYEMSIPEEWEGRTISGLLSPLKDSYPVALSRAGRSVLPEPGIQLKSGDLLSVSSTFEGMGALAARLTGKAEA